MSTIASPAEPALFDRPIAGPSAWRGRDLRAEEYRVTLSAACLDEIRRAVDTLRAYPLPTIVLDPAEFELAHCRAAMTRVREILKNGVRLALVDRLPLDEMTAEEGTAIYWLLAGMIARPVAQKMDGTLIYHVRDTGQQAIPGSGIRPDQTNIEIRIHNDNSYNTTPPEYVGLLCLRTAVQGGHSRVVSFHTAYNEMLERHRDLLPRLYRPFWFDRQREVHAGDPLIFGAPVFESSDSGPRTRFSSGQIRAGYTLKGEPIDNEGAAAIAAMLDIFADDDLAVDFDLAPGEMQFVDNRALGHSRTEFEDDPAPDRRRHLVRLWLRDHGRRAYPG